MAKKDLKDLLGKKAPGELRRGVQQIDILQQAADALSQPEVVTDISAEETLSVDDVDKADEVDSDNSRSQDSQEKSKRSKANDKRSKKRENPSPTNRSTNTKKKPHIYSQKDVEAVLAVERRPTERYSFEIYCDQKDDIQSICDLYEQATGVKLSASRLIREVLDTFIPDALKTFEKSE